MIDVACGTGALTRTVARFAGTTGKVIGYDINEGMLCVARNKNPEMTWRLGNVESMPFDDSSVAFAAPAHILTATKTH